MVHPYEVTKHPCIKKGVGHGISNLALGVGSHFLGRREGVGHVFFYQPHFKMLNEQDYCVRKRKELFSQIQKIVKLNITAPKEKSQL